MPKRKRDREEELSSRCCVFCEQPLQGAVVDDKNCCLDSTCQVAKSIVESKYTVFIVGAGISTACGLPDFRSKGSGLYDQLYDLGICEGGCVPDVPYDFPPLPDPESLFDIGYFKEDPRPFYFVARKVFPNPDTLKPSTTHEFLAWLEAQRKLQKTYTQNIDGLEENAGLRKLVHFHGSFSRYKCMSCRLSVPASDVRDVIEAGEIAKCQKSSCAGTLKPCIVFFGEKVSNAASKSLEKDLGKAQLVVVMGTSLKVAPLGKVMDLLEENTVSVLINKERIHPEKTLFDHELLGSCDDMCLSLWNKLTNYLKCKKS